MCGRYAITLPPEAVRGFFRYVERPNFPPRYNIAPTQPVPIVRLQRDADGEMRRHFALVRWGFLPGFVKDPKAFPLILNARAETLAEKASFRNALKRRRCIVIADGFYEWLRPPAHLRKAPSRPFLIRRADRAPLALAGLWETWLGADGSEMETNCIVTTSANGTMSAVHDRMPVVLERGGQEAWLDAEGVSAPDALALARPAADDVLELTEIGTAVNKAGNDGPEVQEPVARAMP